MREICTSGSVGGEGGNILTYPAVPRLRRVTVRLGRSGTPPARHYDLAARSSLHGCGGNAADGSAALGQKPSLR